jgi:hypothetical protein
MAGEQEILRRLDEHMARANEHMARGNELMEEIREQHELNRREHELNREAYRQGMELMARLIERVDASSRRSERVTARMVAQIEENTETLRALRDSVIAFLNRLDEGGGATPA